MVPTMPKPPLLPIMPIWPKRSGPAGPSDHQGASDASDHRGRFALAPASAGHRARALAKRLLPGGVRAGLRALYRIAGHARDEIALARARAIADGRGPGDEVRFLRYTVRVGDEVGFYCAFKDEFVRRIYHFESERPRPLIIDGGGSIGMSTLYFKHVYPEARVITFEPDPAIFRLLEENVRRNHLSDVRLVNAGLAAERGTLRFLQGESLTGRLSASSGAPPIASDDRGAPRFETSVPVPVVTLSDYLDQEVDFLKLNIEGQELPVLMEVEKSGKLSQVRELVLEYHGWGEGEQRLGALLTLLDRNGFRYLVHDFDSETSAHSKPPFRRDAGKTWFCLVHAFRTRRSKEPA